jgi:hypothetical protein
MRAAQADFAEGARRSQESIFGVSILAMPNILVVMLHEIPGWATLTRCPFQVGDASVGDAAE